jgi:hypothetical protein
MLERTIETGRGGVFLRLTPDQYARLRGGDREVVRYLRIRYGGLPSGDLPRVQGSFNLSAPRDTQPLVKLSAKGWESFGGHASLKENFQVIRCKNLEDCGRGIGVYLELNIHKKCHLGKGYPDALPIRNR